MDNLLDQMTEQNTGADVEMALLSLCMRRNDAVLETVQNKIIAEDFSDKRNRLVYSAILDMYFDNLQIDRFTVSSELERRGVIEMAGGHRYVYHLGDTTAVQSNIGGYIEAIKEKSNRRRILKALEEIRKLTLGGQKRSSEVVDYAISEMTQLRIEDEGKGIKTMSVVLKNAMVHLVDEIKNEDSGGKIKLGFPKLDMMLGGLRPGSLNILAARPGMGKSALAMNMAVNVAANQKAVVIFSLEMNDDEFAYRLLSSAMNKPVSEILNSRKITEDDRRQLDQALVKLGDYPMYIDDTAVGDPATIKAKLQQMMNAGIVPKLVIVDYLQLIRMKGLSGRTRTDEVAEISRSLKLLAKELNVPILALSQVNRKAEEHGTPQMTDLAESDGIARDADTIMFVDRPDYHSQDSKVTDDSNYLEGHEVKPAFIHLAKNRHGKVGKDNIWWIPDKTMFYEYSGKDPVDPDSSYAASKTDENEAVMDPPLSEDEGALQKDYDDLGNLNDDYPPGF